MRENGVATLGWKCTLSLDGPLIIYPYWTQFTLKLTGSRLVSLAKLTSKLTIYDRLSVGSLARSLDSFFAFRLFFWPNCVRQRDAPNPSKCHRIRDRCRREGDIWRSLNFHKFIAHLQPTFRIVLKFAAISTSRTRLSMIYFYEAPLVGTLIPEIFHSNANHVLVLYV